ncbi:glycosyltransferase family 4 protein [Marinobacter sp. 2_MG-2023]|uniref:glycosyltransferase family 4 protein n=1 Tax=Marinobacter sp. 2_MG-2023 TaxID=3062679 RepID=UPI0026E194F6|nr:glycosyltransferase family 4 protein [Marinobacter sp. 2_MG-2023]MDO6442521.1 glycosyltransferase family 4 protein [Marinobacter sp. 2_MG-2023]
MKNIRVGITEMHGIAKEYSKFPPPGVEYSKVESTNKITKYIFRSAAKGVYSYVNSNDHDIIEAPLFPVITKKPWVYTPAHFSSAGTFDLFGIPTPRVIKMIFVKQLLKQDNFKKLLFKSHHGKRSLIEYGNINDPDILSKTDVVYPAVRLIPDHMIKYNENKVNLLFVGEFLRKGGANVVDAFLRLRNEYEHIHLTICSSRKFQTNNRELELEYLKKIDKCPEISIGFYDRETLMNKIIPESDIYLCPTYQEAWGFSIQEAMAFGRAIVTTNISAIPEMIEDGESGLMIPIRDHEFIKSSKGYIVNTIPKDFKEFVTEHVYQKCRLLIENYSERKRIGQSALEVSRTKFSMENRQKKMLEIYTESLKN